MEIHIEKKIIKNFRILKNIIENNLSIIKFINKIKLRYNLIIVSVIAPLAKTRNLAKKFSTKNTWKFIYIVKLIL